METVIGVVQRQGYYLIAEIGVNYYDIAEKYSISLIEAAKLMCREAKESGADAVKFQSYKANTLASKYSPSYWNLNEEPTTSQYELFKKYDLLSEMEYQEIADFCNSININFMSTPFDYNAVDYLDRLINTYKISSSDLTNIPFIEYICSKNKPIILSTGAAFSDELENAVKTIKKYGNELILLHCVLEYPTPLENANLKRIIALKEKYEQYTIGYSDHTKVMNNYDVIKAAYLLGAQVIEKHFTLDKTLHGNDHYHAMDAVDLRNIKDALDNCKVILGNGEISCSSNEDMARKFAHRSIVIQRNMKQGDCICQDDIIFKRPGTGIAPSDYKNVVGKKLLHDVYEDYVLQWTDLA